MTAMDEVCWAEGKIKGLLTKRGNPLIRRARSV